MACNETNVRRKDFNVKEEVQTGCVQVKHFLLLILLPDYVSVFQKLWVR